MDMWFIPGRAPFSLRVIRPVNAMVAGYRPLALLVHPSIGA